VSPEAVKEIIHDLKKEKFCADGENNQEREKEVFREIYNNIPILKEPVTNFSSVTKV